MKPAPPVTRYLILSPGPSKDRTNRAQDNGDIHGERTMLDVVKIIFELDHGLRDARNVSIIDLCPAGEPWLDEETRPIERNLFLVFIYQPGSLSTRPHKAHLASEHRPKLRQF